MRDVNADISVSDVQTAAAACNVNVAVRDVKSVVNYTNPRVISARAVVSDVYIFISDVYIFISDVNIAVVISLMLPVM